MRTFFIITMLSGLVLPLVQESSGQDSGLAFLRIGTDAAGLAQGDAGVASERGAFATYWNPAGLASERGNQLAVSHHAWIANVKTYAAASRLRIGRTTGLGLYVTATGAGDLEARTEPGDPAGLFDAQFVSAGMALGHRFGPIRGGITVKYLSERIYVNSANGFAFDFGLQTTILGGGMHLGAALQNVGHMERLNARATKLPRIIRVGMDVFPFRIISALDDTPLLNASVLLEVTYNTVTESQQLHLGLSAEVLEMVTARLGYLTDDVLRDFSAGLGLAISNLRFDYAVLPFEAGFGGPAHILTLSYDY